MRQIGTGRLRVRIDPVGARIDSLRFDGRLELLARTPWADDDLDGHSLADSNAEWHRRYRGGWDVLLPHAGDARSVDGVEHPFHGEAARCRWAAEPEDVATAEFAVRLRSVPFRLRRRFVVADDRLVIEQTVRNDGDRTEAFTWVEHAAWDGALFDRATEVRIDDRPASIVEPGEASFAAVPAGAGGYRIASPTRRVRIDVRFDPEVFPVVWFWQERFASAGFPWHRAFDGIGLEPAARGLGTGDDLGPLSLTAGATMTSRLVVHVADL